MSDAEVGDRAASVPRCSATSKVFSSDSLPAKSSQPNSHGTMQQVPARADREELGEPLGDAEGDGVEDRHG